LEFLKNNFAGGVDNFLCFSEGERDEEAVSARKRLAEEKDYSAALEYFPKHLKYERILIDHLSKYKNDYAGAVNKLPRNLQLLFIHAFQSYLFNNELKKLLESKKWTGSEELDLIGYESQTTPEQDLALQEFGLTKESFQLKTLSYLSSRGSKRKAFVKVNDFSILSEDPLKLRFSLGSGSYATVVIDYLLE
ncbi:tRNA pseudouridine(13) synthase TruD, partial [Candidatus Micrarchaeota archaeon]|nr:tRNA pseudouridine(13) synthase TruD [Candidatus Micrarchaeota archaeon]